MNQEAIFPEAVGAVSNLGGPLFCVETDRTGWQIIAQELRQQGARLLGIWGESLGDLGFLMHALFLQKNNCLWCRLRLPETAEEFPSLSAIFPTASRQERAIADLLGVHAQGNTDRRPWLRHAAWPASFFPLRQGPIPQADLDVQGDTDYAYVTLSDENSHEIPVGPVHAGTIEPGHFRFTCLGEHVLHLEERLGYTHKGVERLFHGLDPVGGLTLAGRISGDSTVAYTWAYSMALENIAGITLPDRATTLRGLCLERERLANHLGDLGAMGNDAGLAFALTQLLALKEELLQENERIFGHRYLMDVICLGGVATDLSADACRQLRASATRWQKRLQELELLLREHAGLRDRLVSTGPITPARAVHWGLGGLAGRASNQAWDLRVHLMPAPYDRFPMTIALASEGDVAARWAVRFAEVFTSLRWQAEVLAALPDGRHQVPCTLPKQGQGLGIVEGWRGEVFVALRLDAGKIARCHPHDPSWSLWPVLEEAVLQDIVADFPLINKSFNLSYSGHDL
ncbi:MAG: NADH-quinone oxidoreductase subunit C [Acidithiobacillus sp.]|nr:NADH-quinone oxidoreductase subunit C [Acidithiobacillus sp.]